MGEGVIRRSAAGGAVGAPAPASAPRARKSTTRSRRRPTAKRPSCQAGASAPTDSRDFEAFLPKLGLTYNWTDDLSTSAIVQRGYRSGGSTVNIARSTVVPYDPEYTWNYEFSLRSLWLDGDLSVNANAYYIDWTDQQVWVNLGLNDFDTQTENAGSSHLYGFEVEADATIARGIDLYGALPITP